MIKILASKLRLSKTMIELTARLSATNLILLAILFSFRNNLLEVGLVRIQITHKHINMYARTHANMEVEQNQETDRFLKNRTCCQPNLQSFPKAQEQQRVQKG